jgi:uncharacterized protein YigE (DUF2233 family)
MRWPLPFLLLAACTEAAPVPPAVESACREERFEGSGFTVCAEPRGSIEVRSGARSFAEIQAGLGARSERVAFAMNAGMFDETGKPIGLMIEQGRELHAINRREGGGNFHLLPNGVLLVRKSGRAEVVSSERFVPKPDISFASQSGPMLVIDGEIHPKFDPDGESRFVRNGVGVSPGSAPLFVISGDAVSLGKFARFFRDRLKVRDALYFDGSVSSLWDPANGRMDSFAELGPIVVTFRRAESAPHREAHATP